MRHDQIIQVDGYTRFCLTAIVILLSALVVGLWATGPAGQVAPAQAGPPVVVYQTGDNPASGGIPDAGMQRLGLLEATRETNAKLDRLLTLLESGKLHMIADLPEKGSSDAPSPHR